MGEQKPSTESDACIPSVKNNRADDPKTFVEETFSKMREHLVNDAHACKHFLLDLVSTVFSEKNEFPTKPFFTRSYTVVSQKAILLDEFSVQFGERYGIILTPEGIFTCEVHSRYLALFTKEEVGYADYIKYTERSLYILLSFFVQKE